MRFDQMVEKMDFYVINRKVKSDCSMR